MTPQDELPKLLDLALAEAAQATAQLRAEHGLDALAGWLFDEQQGRLVFGDPARPAVQMAAQAVGVYEAVPRRWRWAWHEPGLPPQVLQAAGHARAWGQLNGLQLFTEPECLIEDDLAWRLCAFTARLVGWPGIYRGTVEDRMLFLAFAPIQPANAVRPADAL